MKGGKRDGAGAPYKFYANIDDFVIVEINGEPLLFTSVGTDDKGNVLYLIASDGQTITLRRPSLREITMKAGKT